MKEPYRKPARVFKPRGVSQERWGEAMKCTCCGRKDYSNFQTAVTTTMPLDLLAATWTGSRECYMAIL